MAEPRSEWGQTAVEDIAGLKGEVADVGRRLGRLESRFDHFDGKLDGVNERLARLEGSVRGVGTTIVVLLTIFGGLGVAGGAWVASKTIEHEVRLEQAETRADPAE